MRSLRRALIVAMSAAAVRAVGAQVVEVRAGGSTLYQGFGVATGVWSDHYDGWLGVGYQEQWRFGGFFRARGGRDTLKLGNDVLTVKAATDVFSEETHLLVQGLTVQARRAGLRLGMFTGASATGVGVPLFASRKADRLFTGVRLDDSLPGGFAVGGIGVFGPATTLIGHARWRAPDGSVLAAAKGGGDGKAYDAVAGAIVRDRWEVRSNYIVTDPGFRRVGLPVPAQTTLDDLNVEVSVQPFGGAFLSLARHHFVSDSGLDRPVTRAQGSSAVIGYTGEHAHIAAGVHRSHADAGINHNGYIAGGAALGSSFGADAYLLRSRLAGNAAQVQPALMLHERVNQRLVLDQTVMGAGRGMSVALGGSYIGRFGEYSLTWQIVHDPFDAARPFKRAAALSARLQLGEYSASVSSTVDASGRASYTANAERFLYLAGRNGVSPTALRVRLDRYLVEGVVRDEAGVPVAGAAIALGDEIVFTDSQGRFFARVPRRREITFAVRLDEFLAIGSYSVVSAPATVMPEVEGRTTPVIVVLRRR